jgi:hypothetical protein
MPDNDQPQRDEIARWATDDLESHLEHLKREGIAHLRSLRKDGRPAHDDGLPQLVRDLVRQLQGAAPSLTHAQALEIVEKAFAKAFNESMIGTVVEKRI